MGMTIDEAIRDLVYLKGCGIFPFNYSYVTDAKQPTIATDECITVVVDTMRKYQKFQLDYEARLKADMVAMLTELHTEIEELPMYYDPLDISDLIQQKINKLKETK